MRKTVASAALSGNGLDAEGLISKVKRLQAAHPALSLQDAVTIVRGEPVLGQQQRVGSPPPGALTALLRRYYRTAAELREIIDQMKAVARV